MPGIGQIIKLEIIINATIAISHPPNKYNIKVPTNSKRYINISILKILLKNNLIVFKKVVSDLISSYARHAHFVI